MQRWLCEGYSTAVSSSTGNNRRDNNFAASAGGYLGVLDKWNKLLMMGYLRMSPDLSGRICVEDFRMSHHSASLIYEYYTGSTHEPSDLEIGDERELAGRPGSGKVG